MHRKGTKSKKEQGDRITGWQTDGQVCYTSSQKITITSSKLLSIPINYIWKAHGPGSMPLVRFPKHSVWTVASVASHKGIQGRVGFQTASHWSQKMPHQHFPALSCGAGAAPGEGLPTPKPWPPPWLEKEFAFIFLHGFQQCLCHKARGLEKKSLKEIWKLTSETPCEIRGTNT